MSESTTRDAAPSDASPHGDTPGQPVPQAQVRRVLMLQLSGLVAVHAARAAHMALAGVPGIVSANVGLSGAEVELVGQYDHAQFEHDVRAALEPVGLGLVAVSIVHARTLPQA